MAGPGGGCSAEIAKKGRNEKDRKKGWRGGASAMGQKDRPEPRGFGQWGANNPAVTKAVIRDPYNLMQRASGGKREPELECAGAPNQPGSRLPGLRDNPKHKSACE